MENKNQNNQNNQNNMGNQNNQNNMSDRNRQQQANNTWNEHTSDKSNYEGKIQDEQHRTTEEKNTDRMNENKGSCCGSQKR